MFVRLFLLKNKMMMMTVMVKSVRSFVWQNLRDAVLSDDAAELSNGHADVPDVVRKLWVYSSVLSGRSHGRINHSGPHTNVRRGPFSHTRTRIFSLRVHFSSPKKLTTFLVVVVTFKRLNMHCTFKGQHSVVKIWQLIGGGGWRRGPLPWYNRHNG